MIWSRPRTTRSGSGPWSPSDTSPAMMESRRTGPILWTGYQMRVRSTRQWRKCPDYSDLNNLGLKTNHTHIMNVGNHNHVHHLFCFLSPGSLLVYQHPDLFLHRCAGGHSLPHALLHHSCLPEVRHSCSFISLYVSEKGTWYGNACI